MGGAAGGEIKDPWEVAEDLSEAKFSDLFYGNFAIKVIWDDVVYPSIKYTMGKLGFQDEQIIKTEVLSQPVFNPEDSSNLLTTLALRHQQDCDGSVISHLAVESARITDKYSGLYNYAKTAYSRHLPTTNITGNAVSPEATKAAIDADLDIDCTILDVRQGTCDKWIWAATYLRDSNYYQAASLTLLYTDPVYEDEQGIWLHQDIYYNSEDDNYICQIGRSILVETIITVEPNEDDDSKDDVTTQVIKTRKEDDLELSNTSTTETVDKDTVEESDVFTYENQVDFITIPLLPLASQVIAKFYIDSELNWNYWLYEIGAGTYPDLDENTSYSLQYTEFLPSVILRNNTSDIDHDKTSSGYKEAKDLLNLVGVDIDSLMDNIRSNPGIDDVMDVIFNYTINVHQRTPEIAKLLYITFEGLFNDTNLYQNTTTLPLYMATVQETPYNIYIAWQGQTREVIEGSIGLSGTYTNNVSGNNLILCHQINEDYYIKYTLISMVAGTYIDRYTLVGTSVKPLSSGLEMPLAFFALNELSAVEQTALFPYTLKLHFYSAEIITIDWYAQGAFKDFLTVVAIIVAIIIIIFTDGLGAELSAYLISAVEMLAVGAAAGYALKLIMSANMPDWLKVILVVVVIVVSYVAGADLNAGEFLSAEALTASVTEASATTILNLAAGAITTGSSAYSMHTQQKMDELTQEQNKFANLLESKYEELEKLYSQYSQGLNPEDITQLNNVQGKQAYLKSVDAFYYIAKGQVQYDYGLLYDYDIRKDDFITNKLRLGII